MHISFLLHNAYGIGGTIRTTFNLATVLAEQHDVEIVSVFRHRDKPDLDLSAAVSLSHLVDLRRGGPGFEGDDPAHARPSAVFPVGEGRYRQYSRLTDARISRHLDTVRADVVVGTRPGLNVHLAHRLRGGPVRVGQEHLSLSSHNGRLRREIGHRYRLLDAVTTVTEADAGAYRSRLRLPGVRIEAIPNGVPAPAVAPADAEGHWVVAAGRLTPVKRYDLLVRAFARVVAVRPDWRLRIYGRGDAVSNVKETLRGLIDELGLYNHVFLMGSADPLEAEWVKGSIAAVTSSRESFGMTIVEAMRCGVPVVATDCPYGPGEIIENGVDGRLVPNGDEAEVARALLELIEDDALRRRAGQAALAASARFDPALIAARHERLFTDLRKAPRRALRDVALRGRSTVLDGAYSVRNKAVDVIRKGR